MEGVSGRVWVGGCGWEGVGRSMLVFVSTGRRVLVGGCGQGCGWEGVGGREWASGHGWEGVVENVLVHGRVWVGGLRGRAVNQTTA